MRHQEAHEICKKHMYRYVSVTMTSGAVYDGIVENVDDENLYLAVPIGGMDHEQMRAFLPYALSVSMATGIRIRYYGYSKTALCKTNPTASRITSLILTSILLIE